MSLLLDTHAVIWWRAEDSRLGAAARKAIAEANRVAVSLASAWEIAIKISRGKLKLPEPFERAVAAAGFVALPITVEHAAAVENLPWHHRDPFDRMLIAQAKVENLAIVTADPAFAAYGIQVVAA